MACLTKSRRARVPEVDKARIRELRYGDGLSCSVVSILTGWSESAVRVAAPGRPGTIDNTRLREAFERSGLDAAVVAGRVGWMLDRPDGVRADTSRLRRTLGITLDYSGSKRRYSRRRMIDAETAGLIADALGIGRWEIESDA